MPSLFGRRTGTLKRGAWRGQRRLGEMEKQHPQIEPRLIHQNVISAKWQFTIFFGLKAFAAAVSILQKQQKDAIPNRAALRNGLVAPSAPLAAPYQTTESRLPNPPYNCHTDWQRAAVRAVRLFVVWQELYERVSAQGLVPLSYAVFRSILVRGSCSPRAVLWLLPFKQ